MDEEEVCRVCNCRILRGGGSKISSSDSVVIVFKCRHVYHSECLGETNECGLCSRIKARGADAEPGHEA